jgi:hypothetical protein
LRSTAADVVAGVDLTGRQAIVTGGASGTATFSPSPVLRTARVTAAPAPASARAVSTPMPAIVIGQRGLSGLKSALLGSVHATW